VVEAKLTVRELV